MLFVILALIVPAAVVAAFILGKQKQKGVTVAAYQAELARRAAAAKKSGSNFWGTLLKVASAGLTVAKLIVGG